MTDADRSPWQARQDAVLALARALNGARFPTGDRAALRRLAPDAVNRPAFWRLLVENAQESLRPPGSEGRWAMVLHGMAVLPHGQNARLGTVLADVGLGEARLDQFLRARDDQFWPASRRVFTLLSRHADSLDWIDMARLIFAQGDEAQKQRRHVARDYFSAVHAKTAK